MGLPHDTLRTTTCSYYTLPTLYNLTLVEYNRSLAEYGRILYIAVDGILPQIAVYCLYIAVVGKTQQNMAEYSRRYALVLLRVLCIIQHLLTQQLYNNIYPFSFVSYFLFLYNILISLHSLYIQLNNIYFAIYYYHLYLLYNINFIKYNKKKEVQDLLKLF